MANRYLIIQLADIGDLVLSTPALAALRESQPDAHIAVLTTAHAAPILYGAKLADEIITFDKHTFDNPKALLKPGNLRRALGLAKRLRAGSYDTTLFFHHFSTRFGLLKFIALALSARSRRRVGLDSGDAFFLTDRLPDDGFGAKHQAQYWLDLVGLLGADSSPRGAHVSLTAEDRVWVKLHVPNPTPVPSPNSGGIAGDGVRIAIHPGSGGYSTARRWDADKFAAVADALVAEFGAQIVLIGGENDDGERVKAAMKTTPVDLIGQTTLGRLAALLEACDLFIGTDSGVLHIAAAVGTPIVAIFGPSNPAAWGPWSSDGRAVVVRSAPECSPCSYVGISVGLRNGCPARTCMRLVTADDVLTAARQLLRQSPPQPLPIAMGRSEGEGTNAVGRSEGAGSNRIRLLGLPVDAITYADWLALIAQWANSPLPEGEGQGVRAHHVCTVNPEFIMIAQGDVNFYNILTRADLCIPDGVGLLWAARHLGKPLPDRVTGSDGVPRIAERAAQTGWRLFLLGAAPGVADKAADILRARYPGVHIVGAHSGSPAPDDEDAIVERVNASGADILFVAYGAPVQDKWIARNLPRLRVRMAMGVGGALDFIAGVLPRAPLWMQRVGLEWLFRLYLQPWRIKRMLRLPRFVLAVLWRKDRPPRMMRGSDFS